MTSVNKPKVLIAAHIGEPNGGISTYYEAILNSDLKNHVDLHFIETSSGNLRSGERGKWKLINWFNGIGNIIHFLSALITVKPNIVHIGTAYGASFAKHSVMVLLARIFFIPIILHPHCSINKLVPNISSYWKMYVIFILRQCQGIIIISKEWEVLSSLIPNLTIRYIPNAIDIAPYIHLPRPRENANGNINILYLGHIIKEKGIFDLIQAVANIHSKSDIKFLVNIVGECLCIGEMDSVSESITSNNLQGLIKIFEPEYGEKKINRLASTDIFVLPSYHEGMPMSVIEAMASGLPVVASNVGGIPELVADQESGLLLAPGDVTALSNALLELMGNLDECFAMGAAGRHKAVQKFGIECNVAALISLYQDIVAARRNPVSRPL